MPDIKVSLPSNIIAPASKDIRDAKQYVLLRTQEEIALVSAIDEIFDKYISRITKLCWKYDIDPRDFSFGANEELRRAVFALLDDMEDEILALIEDFVVPDKEKNKHHDVLLAWMLTLGTHNWGFLRTLEYYIYRFSQDLEAEIAALRYAGVTQSVAISKMRSALHQPYSIPEVITAIESREFFSADMIRSGGTKTDPFTHRPTVGLSKVGATNVTTMARSTLSMVWMRDLYLNAQESGKAGYMVFRGSSYPCSLCDYETTYFHPIEQGMVLPVHANCCCFAVFLNSKDVM